MVRVCGPYDNTAGEESARNDGEEGHTGKPFTATERFSQNIHDQGPYTSNFPNEKVDQQGESLLTIHKVAT